MAGQVRRAMAWRLAKPDPTAYAVAELVGSPFLWSSHSDLGRQSGIPKCGVSAFAGSDATRSTCLRPGLMGGNAF